MQRGDTQPTALTKVQADEKMAWSVRDVLEACARLERAPADRVLAAAVVGRYAELARLADAHRAVRTITVTLPPTL
jgi:hypothetical protein